MTTYATCSSLRKARTRRGPSLPNRLGRPSRLGRPNAGGALHALLFWVFAVRLFGLPFLRERDGLGSEEGDFSRAEDDIPFAEDVAIFEEDFDLPLGQFIEEASKTWFGPNSEALEESGILELARLPEGRAAYEMHCIGCHGVLGDGAGVAARYLAPRPRNFRHGLFKFKATGSGKRPRREDLFRTLTRGLAGSSMPDFRLVADGTRRDLVEYVRYLGARGEFERMLLDTAWDEEGLLEDDDVAELAEIVMERWSEDELRPVFPSVAETESSPASIAAGRALFNDPAGASCFTCHGPEGRGDGPTAGDYLDDWGYPLRPRDLTAGVFRAGVEGVDLYRTIAVGITGTPMGSFEGSLTGEQIWDLVHFVQSLPRKAE